MLNTEDGTSDVAAVSTWAVVESREPEVDINSELVEVVGALVVLFELTGGCLVVT